MSKIRPGQRTNSRGSPPAPDHIPTDRRILEHARRAFNEHGVMRVGIREIARDLGLSPGNVSYHFSTKEHLVTALIREGHADNNAALTQAVPVIDFRDLSSRIRSIMQRDIENRWLMRDYIGLMMAMPTLRALHERLQKSREQRIDTMIESLVQAGLLDGPKVEQRRADLRRQIFTQTFFWLQAALISAPRQDPSASLGIWVRPVMALFPAYCTALGRRQVEAILDES